VFVVFDVDKNGFMVVIFGLDCLCGLDLIFYIFGGDIVVIELLVVYLWSMFGMDFCVIVFYLVMFVGIMIVLVVKEIVFGKYLSFGFIDL